jgi:hypothetical protein
MMIVENEIGERTMQLQGIHHLTAITANAKGNHDFYTQFLGLRLVKKTPVAGLDSNFIMLGEVQVIANKLLDMPSPRSGMATAVFGGCLVVFGGQDASGFSNTEVRLFDMLRNLWVPAFTPLGTTPAPRASAVLALLPAADKCFDLATDAGFPRICDLSAIISNCDSNDDAAEDMTSPIGTCELIMSDRSDWMNMRTRTQLLDPAKPRFRTVSKFVGMGRPPVSHHAFRSVPER